MASWDLHSALRGEIEAGKYREFFASGGEAVVLRGTSGRLEVLGAMGAYAGATVAQMALPSRLAVALQVARDGRIRVWSEQIGPPLGEPRVVLDLHGTLPAEAEWAVPVQAVCGRFYQDHRLPPTGLAILIRSEIPIGAGQGSGAALAAALGLALFEAHRIPHSAEAVAALVAAAGDPFEADGRYIDASSCMQPGAGGPRLLRYSAQPRRFVGPVPLPADVRMLALDTAVRYRTAGSVLNEIRVAASMGLGVIETIYRDLGQAHTPLDSRLANVSPLLYRQYFRALLPKRMRGSDFLRTYTAQTPPAAMEPGGIYRIRTAVDHLIAEHEHAEQFLQAMEELAETPQGWMDEAERQRTLQRSGRLLLASHHSYRLRLELSCREADWVVDRLMEAGPERGIYGARITASGGGGTVAALLSRSAAATDALLEMMRGYTQLTGLKLGVTEG